MAKRGAENEIISVNVGGKRFTLRRCDLCADPKSRLTEWFKPGSNKAVAQDKSGNFFLDRDGKSFRYIVSYLRLKREKCTPTLALPSKPDELAKLIGEADALGMTELKEQCVEMLQRYQREEGNYITAYIGLVLRDFDSWQFDKVQGRDTGPRKKESNFDDWDAPI